MPLIAVLRGLTPENAATVGQLLVDSGFRVLEVPLNSPHPLKSIRTLAEAFGDRAMVGAGTVTRQEDVEEVANAGGSLIVMPHLDGPIVVEAKWKMMACVPGVVTPTEAFAALKAGADGLKLFPSQIVSPAAVGALRAVLPARTILLPVGGITPGAMADYFAAGADGFGLGSELFKPNYSLEEIKQRAEAFVAAARRG
jgi:2-dehydro-3-deoxyphosphogalactonate aldolase